MAISNIGTFRVMGGEVRWRGDMAKRDPVEEGRGWETVES